MSNVDAADFGINIEEVVVTETSGTVQVEVGVLLENLGSEAATFYGYNLFYTYDSAVPSWMSDLGALSERVFGDAAAFTTITDGTQAAGDIAVSEVNLGMSSDPITLDAGESIQIHRLTANVDVDAWRAAGGNTVVVDGINVEGGGIYESMMDQSSPEIEAGSISLAAVPEPSSIVMLAVFCGLTLMRRRSRRVS